MEQSLGQRIKHLRGDARRAAIERVLEGFRVSGQTRVAFCRDAGIAVVTLGRWAAEVRGSDETPAPTPTLVEIGREEPRPFTLLLPGGIELRVAPGFVESDLRRLLRALDTAC